MRRGGGRRAGPVSVGVVAMTAHLYREHTRIIGGIRDSKKLTELARERWYTLLRREARAGRIRVATALVSERIIDARGISAALRIGIARTLARLQLNPVCSRVLLDGSLTAPKQWGNQQTIIRGDDRVALIAAASVLAKVRRDRYMVRLAPLYPRYHFEEHKGYGSAAHLHAIKRYGLSPIHRQSFCRSLPKSVR